MDFAEELVQKKDNERLYEGSEEGSQIDATNRAWTNIEEKTNIDGNTQRFGYNDLTGEVAELTPESLEEKQKRIAEWNSNLEKFKMSTGEKIAMGALENLKPVVDIWHGFWKGALLDAPAEIIKTFTPESVDKWIEKYQVQVPEPENIEGKFAQPLGQALAPGSLVNKGLKALGVGNAVLRGITADSFVDFTAFAPDDANIADVAKELTGIENKAGKAIRDTLVEYLGKEEDDSELEKRLKNAASGGLTQLTFDTLVAGARSLKEIAKASDMDMTQINKLRNIEKASQSGKIDLSGKEVTKVEPAIEAEIVDDIIGADFNFKNINTSDDVKRLINYTSKKEAETIQKAMGGEKGKLTLEQIDEMATLLNTNPNKVEDLINKFPADTTDLSVKATAMRKLMVETSEETTRMARELAELPPEQITDAQALAFREQLARQTSIQAKLKGTQTEIARALSAFRIVADASGANKSQGINELLGSLGGRETAIEIAKRINGLPFEDQIKMASKLSGVNRVSSVLREYVINQGMLSSPRTHIKNFVANNAFALMRPLESGVSAGISKVRQAILKNPSKEQVFIQESVDMLRGYFEAIPDAFRMAWKTFKEGPQGVASKIEASQYKAFSSNTFNVDEASNLGRAIDFIGEGIRLPGRMLSTADDFNKAIAQNMGYRQQATRAMRNALLDGKPQKEAEEIYQNVMSGKYDDINKWVEDYKLEMTFQQPLGEVGQAFSKAVQKNPLGFVVVPFIKTPTNIFKEFTKRTPLAPIMKEVRDDLMAGGSRADVAMGKIATGSALLGWGATMAFDGVVTGSGPSDPKMQQVWRRINEPYSIKVGDKWVSYQGLEPISTILGMSADIMDFNRWSNDDEANSQLLTTAIGSLYKNLGEKTYLQGIANFMEAVKEPERKLQKYIANTSSLAVPNWINDIRKMTDSEVRDLTVDPNSESKDFNAILNALKNKTPGLGKDLPPKLNYWGETINYYEDDKWQNVINPFNPKKIKYSEIDNELLRLDAPLSMPRREIGGVKINSYQYNNLISKANEIIIDGKNMREYLSDYIDTKEYNYLPDEDKVNVLRKISKSFFDQAKMQIINEDLELKTNIQLLKEGLI